jgi:hypothetical protein
VDVGFVLVDVGFMTKVAREVAREEASAGLRGDGSSEECGARWPFTFTFTFTFTAGDGSSEASPGSSAFDETVPASEVGELAGGMWSEVAIGACLELSMV